MALNLIDLPSGNGGWFKPETDMLDYTFLLEVTAFERQRPTPYGPKDSALATITTFKTAESLANGEPDEVKEGVRIEQTVLARDLAPVLGGATIVTLAQAPSTKPGQRPAWVWRQAGADAKRKVAAYAEAREAAIDAALSDAPSFD